MTNKLNSVTPSNRKGKKLQARFSNGKTVHFGTDSNFVFNKDKTERDRTNYKKRHGQNPREKKALRDPTSAARLSMDLLWGDSRSLRKNIAAYRRKYDL